MADLQQQRERVAEAGRDFQGREEVAARSSNVANAVLGAGYLARLGNPTLGVFDGVSVAQLRPRDMSAALVSGR